jgi:hypothetical protein
MMRDVLDSRASRERGLYRQSYLDRLLAAPDLHHTRIQGNKLWHLALLELWLQRNVDIRGGGFSRDEPARHGAIESGIAEAARSHVAMERSLIYSF